MFRTRILAALASFVVLLCAWNAQATVIDFGVLNGANQSVYNGHVEDGYTVTPTQGNWFEAQAFGAPTPSIFGGPIGQPQDSQIKVTGGTFTFISVDVSSNSAPGTWVSVSGYLNGGLQFGYSHIINVVNQFETLANPGPFMVPIDELFIMMQPVAGVTSFNIDNIVVRAVAAVPAPAGFGVVLLGLVGLGMARRRLRP